MIAIWIKNKKCSYILGWKRKRKWNTRQTRLIKQGRKRVWFDKTSSRAYGVCVCVCVCVCVKEFGLIKPLQEHTDTLARVWGAPPNDLYNFFNTKTASTVKPHQEHTDTFAINNNKKNYLFILEWRRKRK